MVEELEFFREYFKNHSDKYVLIGGIANYLIMKNAGLTPRVTKDLDIVLIVEVLEDSFVKQFWEFIKEGQYEKRQKSSGERRFYRFHTPQDTRFPKMLELFSRLPDSLDYNGERHLTPIPTNDEVSSLSAILLDEEYYALIKTGTTKYDDIPILAPKQLILFKAKAWLDLTDKKRKGKEISDSDIKKHCNDVIKLVRVISPEPILVLSRTVYDDFQKFISEIEKLEFNLTQLGYNKKMSITDITSLLKAMYKVVA